MIAVFRFISIVFVSVGRLAIIRCLAVIGRLTIVGCLAIVGCLLIIFFVGILTLGVRLIAVPRGYFRVAFSSRSRVFLRTCAWHPFPTGRTVGIVMPCRFVEEKIGVFLAC